MKEGLDHRGVPSRRSLVILVLGLIVTGLGGASIARESLPISLRNRTLHFEPGTAVTLPEGSARRRQGFVLLEKAPDPNTRARLSDEGLELHGPVTRNVWVASAASSLDPGSVLLARWVRGWSDLLPQDKLHPRLLDARAARGSHLIEVEVLLRRDGRSRRQVRRVRAEDLEALATDPDVLWIDPVRPGDGAPLLDRVREATGADAAQEIDLTFEPPRYALDGSGVQVAVFDTGVDAGHADLTGRVIRDTGAGTHGTHVAGIVAGSGYLSSREGNRGAPYAWRGIAPAAELASYDIAIDPADYEDAISNHGIEVSTNSFVQSVSGEYDARAATLDDLVRGGAGKPVSIVFAAGNNGTSAQYGTLRGYYSTLTSAKNTISVGATHVDAGRRAGFSSMGPTFDGRIKPDVVAPGCTRDLEGITAPFPRDRYGRLCGTSMAAPVVSGGLALLYQVLRDAHGVDLDEAPPAPSTLKASLIQTAIDLVHLEPLPEEPRNPDTGVRVVYHPGPDHATGWGQVDLEGAARLIRERRFLEIDASPGRPREELEFEVPPRLDDLEVTIAWDDPPALPLAAPEAPKLIHDLDLVLIDPDGDVHRPWVLDPPPHEPLDGERTGFDPIRPEDIAPARRGVDSVNNVEKVTVVRPDGGLWRLRVTHGGLLEDQIVSVASDVSVPEIEMSLSCPGEVRGDEELAVLAHVSHRRNRSRSVRAELRIVREDGEPVPVRSVVRPLSSFADREKELTIPVAGLPIDVALTLEVIVTDPGTRQVLAGASCRFHVLPAE